VVNERQRRVDQGTERDHHDSEKREKKYGLIRKKKDDGHRLAVSLQHFSSKKL